ncbi:little elongation complex subunit 2-like isoform X2 [Daphnia pulex]|nr:little elongation complex subunit 2-like isoform X2 [Daphnia pulex]
MKNNPSAYTNLDPGIAKYVNDAWKTRLATVHLHPSFYKLIGNITLIPKENIITLDMTLDKTVLELGQIPYQIFPKMNTVVKVERKQNVINNRYPTNALENEYQVSKDRNAAKLAPKYGASIAISSNTLSSLAGNVGPLFRRAWDIPITVKEIFVQGKIKKVIFVDEPLPPAEMSVVEKNAFFNRFAIKRQFSTVISKCYKYPGSGKKYGHSESIGENPLNVTEDLPEDIFESHDVNLDSIETFGVEKSTPHQSETCLLGNSKNVGFQEGQIPEITEKIKILEKDESTVCDSDSSGMSLVIDTGSEYGQSPKKKRKTTGEHISSAVNDASSRIIKGKLCENNIKSPLKASQSTTTNLLNVILKDQEKMMQSQRKQNPKNTSTISKENPQKYFQPKKNENLTYRTWDLKVNEKSVRLLVRSSVDTAIAKPDNPLKTFLMVPKTEYQPWYGAECYSPREINEQWMDLYLRPECNLLRMRLDAYSGHLLVHEQKDVACLEAENSFQYGTQNKPANCLKNVWAVLSSLCDLNLSPGKFLLRHGFHDGICIQVWESTDKESSSLDLHQIYAEIDTTANAVRDVGENWVALDPYAVLPIQRALFRPPLTFEPEEGFKKIIRKKGGGKKKKNKKKESTAKTAP